MIQQRIVGAQQRVPGDAVQPGQVLIAVGTDADLNDLVDWAG